MSKDLFCFMYLLGTITPTLRPDLHRVKLGGLSSFSEDPETDDADHQS